MLTATTLGITPWTQIVNEVNILKKSVPDLTDDKEIAVYADRITKETYNDAQRDKLVTDISLNLLWSADTENKLRSLLHLPFRGPVVGSTAGSGTPFITPTATETPITTYLLIGAGILGAFWLYTNYGNT